MSLHIDDRLNDLPDPLYTFNWEIQVPGINKVTESITDPEDFLIRCRNAEIPGRGIEPIESYFMGMKQKFPGRSLFTQTITILMEEFQDQLVTKALNEWSENVFSTKLSNTNAGISQKAKKRGGYATDVYLIFRGNENSELKQKYRLYNCFPENWDPVSLDYATSDIVRPSLTLSYDWWELETV